MQTLTWSCKKYLLNKIQMQAVASDFATACVKKQRKAEFVCLK